MGLRPQIEEANRDFVTANDRFTTAEKEYVEAKMHLHQKKELKEQLTEHLIMIIQEVGFARFRSRDFAR